MRSFIHNQKQNILGEDVFRGKMEKLREEEDGLQNILAGIELAAIEKEHSAGYKNRIKEFLEKYDDSLTSVSFALKRRMVGLLFKNIPSGIFRTPFTCTHSAESCP